MENQILNTDENGMVIKGCGKGGEITHLPDECRKLLSEPLPKDAIQKHPTRKYLSTIKSAYIVERLNDVFGISGWDFEHEMIGSATTSGGNKYIICKGRIYMKEYDLYSPIQYGGHSVTGDEVVDAYKSAVTDALTKCASYLEIGIDVFKGLADKPQVDKKIQSPVKAKPPVKKEENRDEEYVKKYVELFGKPPAKNLKMETIIRKVKEAEAEPKEEAEAQKPEMVDEETGEVVAKSNKQDGLFDDDGNVIEEEAKAESEYEGFVDVITSYVNASSLGEDAKSIIEQASSEGVSEEEVTKLKALINKRYVELSEL